MSKPGIEPGTLRIEIQRLYHLNSEDDPQLVISHSQMLARLQLQHNMEMFTSTCKPVRNMRHTNKPSICEHIYKYYYYYYLNSDTTKASSCFIYMLAVAYIQNGD